MKNKVIKSVYGIVTMIAILGGICSCGSRQDFGVNTNSDEILSAEDELASEDNTEEKDTQENISEEISSESAQEDSLKEQYLSYVTMDDQYEIYMVEQYQGEDNQYIVYEMRDMATEEKIYWNIVVVQNEEVVTVIRENKDDYSMYAAIENIVVEADVNFDGKNDILVCMGGYGAQGAVSFSCYLQTDNGEYKNCPSFFEIANPVIDKDNQVILSSWRNSASSHSWGIIHFEDGEFVMTEMLTEEPTKETETAKEDEIVWSYTEEVLTDGEWNTQEYFTEKDDTEEELQKKIYADDSHWALFGDKWNKWL